MKILMVACSKKGYDLMKTAEEKWLFCHPEDQVITKVKSKAMKEVLKEKEGQKRQLDEEKQSDRKTEIIDGTMTALIGEYFAQVDAILFVCATGIAVRCIAPYLVHKSMDPAVLVVDETGHFCISLLSGHAGGANALATEIAAFVNAVPVITTATDCEGKFAIDEFARKNNYILSNWEKAKELSAQILNGASVQLTCRTVDGEEPCIHGTIPREVRWYVIMDESQMDERAENCIAETKKKVETMSEPQLEVLLSPFQRDKQTGKLSLVPRWIYAGIGCRKGVDKEQIERAVKTACTEAGLAFEAIRTVASIDLKKEEAGLLAFCKQNQLDFITYSAEELAKVAGDFRESEFVRNVTGVGNVCERSAVCVSGGRLIYEKHAYDGVTVAFAAKMEEIKFE